MPAQLLPQFVSPRTLACKKVCLSGFFPLSHIQTIQSIVMDKPGRLAVEVSSFEDDSHLSILKVAIKGWIMMSCERCAQPVKIQLDAVSQLVCVNTDEQAKKVLNDYEPVIVHDEKLDLYALIEEEFWLSLPLIPQHQEMGYCAQVIKDQLGYQVDLLASDEVLVSSDKVALESHKPFHTLSGLLAK